MNLPIVIVGTIIVAGNIAVATMKVLDVPPFAKHVVVKEEEEEEVFVKSIFVDMEPIVIPVFKGDEAVAKVQIQLKLETKSTKKAVRIKRMMPRIKDIFIKDLHAFLPRLLKAEERIDVFILKERMKLIADRKFGKGLIDDVLVQSVVDTPAR